MEYETVLFNMFNLILFYSAKYARLKDWCNGGKSYDVRPEIGARKFAMVHDVTFKMKKLLE